MTKENATTAEAEGEITKKTPTKKAKLKADRIKKKTKKTGERDEKEDLMAGRRKLTMGDLAAAGQGGVLVRWELYFSLGAFKLCRSNFQLYFVVDYSVVLGGQPNPTQP